MALLTLAASAATAKASIGRPQLPSRTPTSRPESSLSLGQQWSSSGLRRRALDSTRGVALAALPDPHSLAVFSDPHSFAVLAMDMVKLSDFPVRIELDPTREIIVTRTDWQLSEVALKTFYMMFTLVFCWGCCVFGSMTDVFYDSEAYRSAGGNGTGHWIYDQQDREERAAREEMWSEDLIKEIEEKAEEVRRAEEEKEKELV